MKMYKNEKMPADNGRFCEMAAVTPQTILWEFAHYYPAGMAMEAATSQSRLVVARKQGRQCSGQ